MPQSHLLILTALYFEAKPIAQQLGLRFTSRSTAESAPSSPRISLHIIGPRARHLPPVPPTAHYHGVILAGLAGGLAPDLQPGDIVLDELSTPTHASPLRRGPIASTPHLVSTPPEKNDLYRTTRALVVDMENATVRDWAAAHQIPFFGIRAVSDTAHESLDPATLRIIDHTGHHRPSLLLRELLHRPSLLPSLWRLRSTTRITHTLAHQVAHLAAIWPPPSPSLAT